MTVLEKTVPIANPAGTRYTCLDLFCGRGGCSVGYHKAGFYVKGVDLKRQHTYPFRYTRRDVRWFLEDWRRLEGWDLIHASPPCQEFTRLRTLVAAQGNKPKYINLIPWTRDTLEEWAYQTGGIYIIENVPGAPIRNDVMLCGTQFGLEWGGKQLQRHRFFESNMKFRRRGCKHKGQPWGVYGGSMDKLIPSGTKTPPHLEAVQELMGIDWMGWKDLTQAIPPAYTEFLGNQVVQALDCLVACERELVTR